jgi:hypothetical protein
MDPVNEFATALHFAAKTFQMYTGEHPKSQDAIQLLTRAANALLGTTERVSLLAAKGQMLLQGKPIEPQTIQLRNLAKLIDERDFGGILMVHGVQPHELRELVRVFATRPAQVKDAGGAERMLDRAGVQHLRISKVRYEALTEGEEVVWKSARRADIGVQSVPEDLPTLLRRTLLRMIQDTSSEALGEGDGEGEGSGDAEAIAAAIESEGAKPEEVLQQALAGMQPEIQLALLLSVGRVASPELRAILAPAARQLISAPGFGSGGEGKGDSGDGGEKREDADAAAMTVDGRALMNESDLLVRLLNALPERDRSLELLRDRLVDLGISRDQLDEILDVVSWEKLTTDEKVQKLLARDQILDFPADKLRLFLRELLEQKRYEDMLRVVERLGRGLRHDSGTIRENVLGTLAYAAALIRDPGASPEIEQMLARLTLNHLLREADPRVQQAAAIAVANLAISYAATGRGDTAVRDLTRLQAAASAMSEQNPAAKLAWDALMTAFGDIHRAGSIVSLVCEVDAETLNRTLLPFIAFVGAAIAEHLVFALAEEEDRNRRGRLVRAMKAIGAPAHPYLLNALESPTWYVVRNALNVLGDIGSPEFAGAVGRRLKHGDARVRRAAARALGKFGGEEAASLLVGAFGDPDAETQKEILLCVGAIRAQAAIPAVIELARPRRFGSSDDAIRELAVTTLGQIGSPAAIPFLSDIIRRRGAFGRDSLQIRVAAAKALAGIGTNEARETLRSAIGAETDSAARESLSRAVDGLRARPT